jgi:hypothetical protein
MKACITIVGNDICGILYKTLDRTPDGTQINNEIRIPLLDDTLTHLKNWARRYDRAVFIKDQAMLLAMGREIFAWLDESGWASQWVQGIGERILEVAVDENSHLSEALLDLPWEILADQKDFLASDPYQPYIVFRRSGPCAGNGPIEPAYANLTAMFMAAAPEGQRELAYEDEEAAILAATERLPMQLRVEESGCRDFLKERLATEGPFEVVHLSCHGEIHPEEGPLLWLETPEGKAAVTPPGELVRALGEKKAPLVFLSACRTAEYRSMYENKDEERMPETAEPYVRALIRAGVPNVLGWDGSVRDRDAVMFAHTFYKELAAFATVPYAAAMARYDLLRRHRKDPKKGAHWHLARVYTGAKGSGALCLRDKKNVSCAKTQAFRSFWTRPTSACPWPRPDSLWAVDARPKRSCAFLKNVGQAVCSFTAWVIWVNPVWRRALPTACPNTKPWLSMSVMMPRPSLISSFTPCP